MSARSMAIAEAFAKRLMTRFHAAVHLEDDDIGESKALQTRRRNFSSIITTYATDDIKRHEDTKHLSTHL